MLREKWTWNLQDRGGHLDKAVSACQVYLWKQGGRETPSTGVMNPGQVDKEMVPVRDCLTQW